ncbi:MAG TPA: hypothetical protein VF140_05520, partial [Phycicoccus sp.]
VHPDEVATTESTPVTPGDSEQVVEEGGATVPRGKLPPGDHAVRQPLAPDGTPMPIDDEHYLTAEPRTDDEP